MIGGGPAGSACAAELAAAGRQVILLERQRDPCDKVCGEFISQDAILHLEALGLDLLALGARPITAVRLAAGRRTAAVALPFSAFSLSRRVLDEALLRRAEGAGVDVRRGRRVCRLEPVDEAKGAPLWRAHVSGGPPVHARTAFLATGKHDMKDWSRPPTAQSDLVGLKMHWRLKPAEAEALAAHVELTLFAGGYAGLQPVENGRANLCLIVKKHVFLNCAGRWDRLLEILRGDCPLLATRLAGAQACWSAPLAIAALPFGHMHRREDGLWRLGDQAAVIQPFTGDGMAIALHSARLAAACYLGGCDAASYHERLRRDVAAALGLATTLSRAALERPLLQSLLPLAASLVPGVVATIARATRTSSRHASLPGTSDAPTTSPPRRHVRV